MHIFETNINGNPNIGLYGWCNDTFCLLAKDFPESAAMNIAKALKVNVVRTSICATSLVGVFCAGNNHALLLPQTILDTELDYLEKQGIRCKVIQSKLTALGNNILCNDHGALVNPNYSADTKKIIRQSLNVSLKPGMIADVTTVGVAAVLRKGKCLIHRDITEEQILYIEDLLKVKCELGTINMGSPYVRAGIICNSNGFVVSDQSWGPEMAFADEALGFLDDERK